MTLGETASLLLAQFSEQLHAQGRETPERAYVAPGNIIPWDGEQLVVVLQQISQGSPGKPITETFVPGSEILTAQFAVAIVREIPALSGEGSIGPMIPGPEELGEAGFQSTEDAIALVKGAIAIHAAHTIVEGGLMGFVWGPCTPVGPEDGLAGQRLLLEVNIDG